MNLARLCDQLRQACDEYDRLWTDIWGTGSWTLPERGRTQGAAAASRSGNLRHKQGRPHLRLVSNSADAPDEGSLHGLEDAGRPAGG